LKDSNNELEELLKDYDATDIIIIGGGPAGLMVAADLAKLDLKILVIEKNSYIREKLWANSIIYGAPIFLDMIREILDEFKVSYKKNSTGAYIIDSLNIRSKIISWYRKV